MKKILFATALFLMFFTTIAFCQGNNPVITGVTSKLKTLLTDHIAEKAYLHFDRPYACYVAGDIIYFKAYVTKGERHEPTNISGMLHVDLINNNNALLQSILIQLTNGVGWGDLSLPDTLQKGSYRVRAWTEWMRNEKNPNYFTQSISVSSPTDVNRNPVAVNTNGQPDLQFFPEGGNLVVDIRSRVAFKAVGPNGLGINVKGVVIDNDNKQVAFIASTHLGMGVFDFLPEQGKKYRAKVTFANGKQNIVNLPPVEDKGITLAVINSPDKLSIEIKANRPYYKENQNKELNLLIYWAGAMRTVTTKLDNEVLGLDLPAATFQTGIATVTLLSQTGEPLNERMVFIQNPDLLNLSLTSNKPAYAKRENVQLNLNAKNKDGVAVNGSFSVSVVDESKISVDEDSENSILSYLLLTSDVKGYVEKPNYYFANVTKETRANLDALMLTQGFRRFAWKELMSDNPTAAITHQPEQYLDISGRLTTKSGAPITDAKILLVSLGQTETTDNQGRFRFAKVGYQTGTGFILKMESAGKNSAVLTLDKPGESPAIEPAPVVESNYNGSADILASLQTNQRQGVLTASNESIVLKSDRIIGPKRNDQYRSSNLGGPGHADQVIHGDEIKNASSLSTGLNGLLRGVYFSSGVAALNNGATISSSGQSASAMLVIVDGVNLGIGANIDQYNPGSVETVEVLKGSNASIYGVEGGQGVLVITSREGGIKEQVVSREMSPGIFSITPQGFYKAHEFYSPVYNTTRPANKIADNRTTIFWKPDIITDVSGNASLNFYNADGTGTYRVEVQGIDGKGNLGQQVYRYKVE